MDKVTASAFFSTWAKTVHSRREHLTSIWRQARAFTSHIKGDNGSVLSEVADKLGLLCYERDYYSLDAVLYKREDLVPNLPEGQYWLRDLRVAFEHENAFTSGLYKEVSHLLITNADLRVLVTYPDRDEQPELERLYTIISGSRHSGQIAKEGSFLIIFGYENGFKWNGYVYREAGWEAL